MSNVIEFRGRVEKEPLPGPFTCSLNRALLTVQYCVMVLEDIDTARDIMQCITTSHDIGRRVTLPGRLRAAVENTDTAATYRAVLGVADE